MSKSKTRKLPNLGITEISQYNSKTGEPGELYRYGETGYGLDDRGVRVRVTVGSVLFSSPRRPDRLWGHPTSYPMDTGGSFHGGKAAGA
jgi:hypothetical protein